VALELGEVVERVGAATFAFAIRLMEMPPIRTAFSVLQR